MNNIDIALLGFIFQNDMHGYDMYKIISDNDGFGAIYTIKIGRLYSILNKLEEGGYVESKLNASGARPPKKMYSITENGKKTFNNWLRNPVKHGREIRINLLIKLYFAEKYQFFCADEIVNGQIDECKKWLDGIINSDHPQENENNFLLLVNEFRISQINAYINWLKTCKRIN